MLLNIIDKAKGAIYDKEEVGVVPAGLKFDGVNDRLDSEVNASLANYAFDNTKNYSFEMVVRINGNGSGNNIFLASNIPITPSHIAITIRYLNNRTLSLYINNLTAILRIASTNAGLFNYGDLLHIVGTIENNGASTILRLYVNGIEVANATGGLVATSTGFAKFSLGGILVNTNTFYGNVTIYRTRFFTDYLASPAEVVELSEGNIPPVMLPFMTLDLDYGKKSGGAVNDLSSAGFDFNLINFTNFATPNPLNPYVDINNNSIWK